MQHPVLLYDGVCGLCHRLVRFLLRRDCAARLRFAPLQGDLARGVLGRHGLNPDQLDTVVLVLDVGMDDERIYTRTRAVLRSLCRIGWPWRSLMLFWPMPALVLDLPYRLVARFRYRLFGRKQQCSLPADAERSRFLGIDEVSPRC